MQDLDEALNVTYTERFFHSVTMFCYGFQYNLRGPAWAVASCSISPPAKESLKNVFFQTLRQSGKNALYCTRTLAVVVHFECLLGVPGDNRGVHSSSALAKIQHVDVRLDRVGAAARSHRRQHRSIPQCPLREGRLQSTRLLQVAKMLQRRSVRQYTFKFKIRLLCREWLL